MLDTRLIIAQDGILKSLQTITISAALFLAGMNIFAISTGTL
jgi:hypothetical protein